MARFVSMIGSRKDGKVEFTLLNEKKTDDFFASLMSPDEAFRLAKKLIEAGEMARRNVEDYDISGENAHMQEVTGKAYREVREKYKVFNGNSSKQK